MRLPVAERIAAGKIGGPLLPGTCARIFTGAPLPPGADTVVPQEDVSREGDVVRLSQTPQIGAGCAVRVPTWRPAASFFTWATA